MHTSVAPTSLAWRALPTICSGESEYASGEFGPRNPPAAFTSATRLFPATSASRKPSLKFNSAPARDFSNNMATEGLAAASARSSVTSRLLNSADVAISRPSILRIALGAGQRSQSRSDRVVNIFSSRNELRVKRQPLAQFQALLRSLLRNRWDLGPGCFRIDEILGNR